MKTNFTFIGSIVIMLLSIFSINADAQIAHVDFTYDAAGNRITRQYFSSRIMNDTASDEVAQQIAEQNGIVVYPNPVQDNFVNVSFSSLKSDEEQSTIYVLDNSGKILFSQKASSSLTAINLSSYSSGIYYIKVMAGEEELFYKITKAK